MTTGKGHLCLSLSCCEVHDYGISPEQRKETIVEGDINAKSPQWGSPTSVKRGQYWVYWGAPAIDYGVPVNIRERTERILH